MRMFVAIEVPEDTKEYMIEIQKKIGNDLAKIRFVDKKQMHLTLKFLGEVQLNGIDIIKSKLKKVEFESFSVYLDSIGVFPDENYVKVVWIGLNPEYEIMKLQRIIDESLKELFAKEDNFKIHLTLGRVKFVKDKEKFVRNLRKINIDNKKVNVNGFKLMKSALSQKGPIYEEIASYTW